MARGKSFERLNLTRAKLLELTPRAKPYEKWDTKVLNLCVRVQPSGRQIFYLVYRNKWHRIGPANAFAEIDQAHVVDIIEARKEAQLLTGLVLDGQMNSSGHGGDTFGELNQRYLKYAEKKNRSWRQTERLIKKHVLPKWADRRAKDITFSDVQALFEDIPTNPLANHVLAAVSVVFQFAKKRGMIEVNPARGIERHDVGDRDRVLSNDELRRLKTALEEIDQVRRAALMVILLTGQRPGEVAHMRREHIGDGWWEMPGKPQPELGWNGTKNKTKHRVFLTSEVRRLIGDGDTGFVFANQSGKALTSLDKAMRLISRRLDPPPATPHDLRRTFASRVGACGHRLEDIERILNHSTGRGQTKTARTYNRFNYERQSQRVSEDVAAHILRLMDGGGDIDNVIDFSRAREG